MDITPLLQQGRQLIQRYGNGAFTISGTEYKGSVIILPTQTVAWNVSVVENAKEPDFMAAWMSEPAVELLLIGCGKSMGTVDPGLRQRLRARGISTDIMDTGAACRTYNVLVAEDRRVAAALIAM